MEEVDDGGAHAATAGATGADATVNAAGDGPEMARRLIGSGNAGLATWEDAYARHFRLVLTTVAREREDYRALFAPDELAVAERFLSELPPLEQRVYARLFQRRGPWLKTASLFRYFRSWGERPTAIEAALDAGEHDAEVEIAVGTADPAEAKDAKEEDKWVPANKEVQKALNLLMALGFLEPMPGNGNRDVSLSASATSTSDTAWRDALEAIEHCASAGEMAALHKKLVGSNGKSRRGPPSSGSSPSLLPEQLSGKASQLSNIKRMVGSQRRIDGSRIPVGKMMQQVWVDNYPLADKLRSDHVVVRVAPRARDVLRRMHRLFYFQAAPPFAPSFSLSSSTDVNQLLGVALSKLRHEPTQWPGLLVFFKKIRYPSYTLVNRRRAFESSELYVCYEVARQLHHIMGFVEQFIEIVVPETPEPDLELKWMLGDSTPPLMAFQRLVTAATAAVRSDGGSNDGFELLEKEGSTSTSTTTLSWQLRSWDEFYHVLEEQISSLDDLALLAKSCLKAYMTWTEHMNRFAAFSTSSSNTEASNAQPSFFVKCNAGHHLACALHTAVTLYEKQRKYQVAILLLNELLATPFLKRKRGYWWERLALNLEHLKCSEQALQTCVNALSDPLVSDTDRISIERRHERLQGRLDRGVRSLPPDDEFEIAAEPATSTDTPSSKQSGDYNYRASYMVGRPLNRAMGEKSRFIGFDDEPCGVEQLVLQYYRVKHPAGGEDSTQPGDDARRGGWYGVHCEGTVLGNLFGIFMWDILYASVPDVFQTPFQVAPLDFGHAEEFIGARRCMINERLANIERGWSMQELLAFFTETWIREFGKLSRFVRWPRGEGDLSLRFLLLVVIAMERESLTSLMRYMATSKEFHHAQNGLPDLLMLQVEPVSTDLDEQVSSLVDEGSGCLDLYAYCGMEYRTNMNRNDITDLEPVQALDSDASCEMSERWEDVLKFLDASKWRLALKLVEVKGPRDRLSDKQLVWLCVLAEKMGVDASVMHVVEEQSQADKQKEKRKKQKQAGKKAAVADSAKKRRKG